MRHAPSFMVFLWRTGAISGTSKCPLAHPFRPSRCFPFSLNSSCTISHQSEKQGLGSTQFLISGVVGKVMRGILCHVPYAKGFPVHIWCYTNLRCWAASRFTGKLMKWHIQKYCSLHRDLLFIHVLYSFAPVVISFLGNSSQMPKCSSNLQVLSVNLRHILGIFLLLLFFTSING